MDITAIHDKAAELGAERARDEIADGAHQEREAPLSGEWAGDPTPRDVARDAGYEGEDAEEIDEIADAWENGYFDAWRYEA